MTQISRRTILGGAAGLTTVVLPAASAAASELGGGGSATVSFAPAYRIFRTGADPNTTTQVQMAWAEGYTTVSIYLTGTSGARAPFSYVITTTDTSDQPVTTSGSSDGAVVDRAGIASKVGTTITVTMTSTEFPGDVRTFTLTR